MDEPQIDFEWDAGKAAANLRKHGVSFDRAASVLRDAQALSLYDRAHSRNEDRWITLGLDSMGQLLVVCHTWRERVGQTFCRIISARRPTASEVRQYTGL